MVEMGVIHACAVGDRRGLQVATPVWEPAATPHQPWLGMSRGMAGGRRDLLLVHTWHAGGKNCGWGLGHASAGECSMRGAYTTLTAVHRPSGGSSCRSMRARRVWQWPQVRWWALPALWGRGGEATAVGGRQPPVGPGSGRGNPPWCTIEWHVLCNTRADVGHLTWTLSYWQACCSGLAAGRLAQQDKTWREPPGVG